MLSWLPLLLLAPLATAYGPHCTDVTVSDCFTEAFLISSTTYTPAECQAGCARTPKCVIWRHFQPSHCSIQIADYRGACSQTGGPTGEPGIWGGSEAFLSCLEAQAEQPTSCDFLLEEECTLHEASAWRQPEIQNPALCADICR